MKVTHWAAIGVTASALILGMKHAQGQSPSAGDLDLVVRQGTGTAEGRVAWERLSQAGPEAVLPLLQRMNGQNTVASNWLRTAIERVLARTPRERLPLEELLRFAQDPRNSGRARRLALAIHDEHRPGTSAKLHAGWLEDPEFRFEAVAVTLDQAKALLKEGARDEAEKAYRRAFVASRDIDQARLAAAGLAGLGIKVSVAEHLGCFRDWYVIGPFDAKGMKGFHLRYPPEDMIDLAAELDGQKGKVRWKRFLAPETSSGRHQALVSLRDKKALGDADDAVGFAYTEFEVDRAQKAEFRGAADDNLTVYVNGVRVFGFEEYRNGVRHDRHRFPVELRAGKNSVLVKVCQTPAPNPEANWEFLLRAVDEAGRGLVMRSLLP